MSFKIPVTFYLKRAAMNILIGSLAFSSVFMLGVVILLAF